MGQARRRRRSAKAYKLVRIIDGASGGDDTDAVIKAIKDKKSWSETFAEIQKFGIFVNWGTLETELFEGDYAQEMIETLGVAAFARVLGTHSNTAG